MQVVHAQRVLVVAKWALRKLASQTGLATGRFSGNACFIAVIENCPSVACRCWSRRGHYLFKQHLVRLRQIEGFHLKWHAAQIAGGPVDFDNVAVRIVEVKGEGHAVVDYELDRNLLLYNACVEGSELGE